jgi:hypothetical protein
LLARFRWCPARQLALGLPFPRFRHGTDLTPVGGCSLVGDLRRAVRLVN